MVVTVGRRIPSPPYARAPPTSSLIRFQKILAAVYHCGEDFFETVTGSSAAGHYSSAFFRSLFLGRLMGGTFTPSTRSKSCLRSRPPE